MSCIFLAGIHGVGKTTLSSRIKILCSIPVFTVSDLIKMAGENIVSNEKSTKNIDRNQLLWKKELRKRQNLAAPFLLDGHFTLLDNNMQFVKLSFSTFSNIGINKIILVECPPSVILKHLLERDKKSWGIELIEKFSIIEHEQAKEYSSSNNIPLFIYNDDALFDSLISFIKNS